MRGTASVGGQHRNYRRFPCATATSCCVAAVEDGSSVSGIGGADGEGLALPPVALAAPPNLRAKPPRPPARARRPPTARPPPPAVRGYHKATAARHQNAQGGGRRRRRPAGVAAGRGAREGGGRQQLRRQQLRSYQPSALSIAAVRPVAAALAPSATSAPRHHRWPPQPYPR